MYNVYHFSYHKDTKYNGNEIVFSCLITMYICSVTIFFVSGVLPRSSSLTTASLWGIPQTLDHRLSSASLRVGDDLCLWNLRTSNMNNSENITFFLQELKRNDYNVYMIDVVPLLI